MMTSADADAPIAMTAGASLIVTMGCGDSCPLVKAARREEWNIPDPKELPDDQFREVRDLIERKVVELLASLERDG